MGEFRSRCRDRNSSRCRWGRWRYLPEPPPLSNTTACPAAACADRNPLSRTPRWRRQRRQRPRQESDPRGGELEPESGVALAASAAAAAAAAAAARSPRQGGPARRRRRRRGTPHCDGWGAAQRVEGARIQASLPPALFALYVSLFLETMPLIVSRNNAAHLRPCSIPNHASARIRLGEGAGSLWGAGAGVCVWGGS